MLETVLSQLTVANMMAILYLVMLEILLSIDNALGLATLCKNSLSDEKDQAKALRYGIGFAYGFRVLATIFGVFLMGLWYVKLLAAGYLFYLSINELFFKKSMGDDGGEKEISSFSFKQLSPLVNTIIKLELLDLSFSLDSIATAVSVSSKQVVLIAGGCLGILAMRFCAQLFIKLLDKYPVLEKTAFVLILFAGVKIVLLMVNIDIPDTLFAGVMFGTIGTSLLLNNWYVKHLAKQS